MGLEHEGHGRVLLFFQRRVAASAAVSEEESGRLSSADASKLKSLLQHGQVTMIGRMTSLLAIVASNTRSACANIGNVTEGIIADIICRPGLLDFTDAHKR